MNIRTLNPELAEKARKELGENSDRLQTDINALRCWVEKQSHLISRTDDQFLVTFLRFCNFSLEESKKRIDAFLTWKATHPDLFSKRSVDETALKALREGLVVIPPNSLPNNGPKIVISNFSKFDPKKCNFKEIVKLRFMLFEILAFDDDISSISGVELVVDLKNCSLSQAFYLDPTILRKTMVYQEQCIPLRIKHLHIINMRKELQGIVQLARSFISTSKTAFEIVVHEKESDLYKYIPQESMTAEYGGKNGSTEEILQEWEQILLDHRAYFEEDALLGTRENLRRNPNLLGAQASYGVEGSFRKLQLD